jgi:hypothetical protein
MDIQEKEGHPITDLYLRYQGGTACWEELKSAVEIYCYRIAIRFFRRREELLTPFITQVFEKVPCLIKHFHYHGTPFEHYLSKTVTMRCKAIAYREAQKSQKELICRCYNYVNIDQERMSGMLAAEHAVCRHTPSMNKEAMEFFGADADGFLPRSSCRRRLLFLALREAERIDDDLVDCIAGAIGADPEWLIDVVTRLRMNLDERKGRYRDLIARRYRLFAKMIELQVRLLDSAEPGEMRELRKMIADYRQRLDQVDEALRDKQWRPTQTEIANVLCIPKGTVGSAIHFLHLHTPECYPAEDSDSVA